MPQVAREITAGTFEFSIYTAVGSHVSLQVGRDRSRKCAFRASVSNFGSFGIALAFSELSTVALSRFLLDGFVNNRLSNWEGSSSSILKS